MHNETSVCCCSGIISESGYRVCINCGTVLYQALETANVSFNQSTFYMARGYSRKTRFVKKVLGSLRCLATHNADPDLMIFLRTRKIKTPQDLLGEISLYPTAGRRPYCYAMYYWVALGFERPICTDEDVRQLTRDFDHIFFAWERLGFQNPKFPYSYTFAKIVTSSKKYSPGMKKMVPFVRYLRCVKRRARYSKLFKLCLKFDYKDVSHRQRKMDEKIDSSEVDLSQGQTMTRYKNHRQKRLSPYDVRGVYKTAQEVNDAKKRGDFDIAKTMHCDRNGDFFFLTFQQEIL